MKISDYQKNIIDVMKDPIVTVTTVPFHEQRRRELRQVDELMRRIEKQSFRERENGK